MERDSVFPDDQLQDGISKNKTERRTIYLRDEDMEKFPDSNDDYRLPRNWPDPHANNGISPEEPFTDDISLLDGNSNLSDIEMRLLEEAEMDLSSDESRAAELLDNYDEEGDALNEGPQQKYLFDTGEELDMPPDINAPDSYNEDHYT